MGKFEVTNLQGKDQKKDERPRVRSDLMGGEEKNVSGDLSRCQTRKDAQEIDRFLHWEKERVKGRAEGGDGTADSLPLNRFVEITEKGSVYYPSTRLSNEWGGKKKPAGGEGRIPNPGYEKA